MGNDNSKQTQTFGQNIDKNKLDVTIKQIYFTAQLNKDRRKGQQNTREKELLALVREPTNKRSKDNEYAKAQALANDVKNISAHECVMRYADIIKDNQTVISLSKGYFLTLFYSMNFNLSQVIQTRFKILFHMLKV